MLADATDQGSTTGNAMYDASRLEWYTRWVALR
jgi:hypothetical protein